MISLNDPGLKTRVFFSDNYYKHPVSIRDFGDNVIYGFIKEDNKNLITFRLGDVKYDLDEKRKVLFMDKTQWDE